MLFLATFISTSEKMGLEKQAANFFLFQFHPEMGSPVFLQVWSVDPICLIQYKLQVEMQRQCLNI